MPSEAKESKDSDASGDAKQPRPAFDDEDETLLSDEAKKPPLRASIGWGTESTLTPSEEKDGGGNASSEADAAAGGATSETKRAGRRRKGAETAGSASGGGERRNQKNRYFDEDEEITGITQVLARALDGQWICNTHMCCYLPSLSADIVEIPDLEEEEREPDITTQVAEAPRNTTRAVQSLKQLDKDIKFALPNATVGLLPPPSAANCNPASKNLVAEADEPWDFDTLLNEISQETQKDLDEKEEFLRAEAAATA
ncbi:hypothetical protein BBJ28_00022313 [Nothophytophthora sp. Chile5]|nr:hypothetical protein BBJ28_00022313 [Nothophytophthora sp. Chile5]